MGFKHLEFDQIQSGLNLCLTRRYFVTSASALAFLTSFAVLTGHIVAMPHEALAEPAKAGEAETQALTTAQKQYDEAKEKLQGIGSQLEQTRYELDETEDQLEKLGVDIKSTQDEIEEKTTQLQSAQSALSAYLVINYKSGTTSTLDLIMSSSDFNDLVTRSYYATKVQDAQVDTINEIKQLKSELEDERNELSTQQDEEKELKQTLSDKEASLTEQQEEANTVVNNLSDEVKQLFQAQQEALQKAAEARATAAAAAESGQALGVNAPSVSQGSIVEDAYACLGIPYVWGGDDDNFGEVGGFDCSGFVQHCYALEGYSIGRTTYDQIPEIQELGNWKTDINDLEPGDLVFPSEGHVGIYIGDSRMIDAPYPGAYIQEDDVTDFIGGGSPV